MVLLISATAGQRNDIDVGNTIARGPAIDRLQADRRCNRRNRIDDHVSGGRRRAGIARSIGCRRREAVSAVSQRPWSADVQAPLPFATTLPSEHRSVIDLDGRVGLRGTSQGQQVGIGDAVADTGAIRRE